MNQNSTTEPILESSDHIIMSEGLSIDLGESLSIEQTLTIDKSRFICSMTKIKKMQVEGSSKWKVEIEVPGLSLIDLIDFEKMIFQYNEIEFHASKEFELDVVDISGPIITITAMRIFNKDE